jgi:hypothetical protein
MTGHGCPPAVRADPWASLLEVPANEWPGGVADRPTRWRNTSQRRGGEGRDAEPRWIGDCDVAASLAENEDVSPSCPALVRRHSQAKHLEESIREVLERVEVDLRRTAEEEASRVPEHAEITVGEPGPFEVDIDPVPNRPRLNPLQEVPRRRLRRKRPEEDTGDLHDVEPGKRGRHAGVDVQHWLGP